MCNRNIKFILFRRIISFFITIPFLCSALPPPSMAQAQSVLGLPAPGTMVTASTAYDPVMIMGMKVYPEDPFLFDFIVHPRDSNLEGEEFKTESSKLIKYFMAALTVPEEEIWVNLSPYEKDRIIPKGFGDTEMGRDLLAQDYMLKQLTASLMYPEDELGNDFWNRVYKRVYEEYGTSEVPMNTFNKVWIVPEKAVIYENGLNVFVVESRLKVLLEEDYLALEANAGSTKHGLGDIAENDLTKLSEVSSRVIHEIIIPEIEKEVNEGKTFANLRQISNAVILATWYKQNIQQGLLKQIYVNQNKTDGIDTEDKQINQKIYSQYVEAFEKGVYNFIREDYDPSTQEVIQRKYFSGGANLDYAMTGIDQSGDAALLIGDLLVSKNLGVRFGSPPVSDAAMLAVKDFQNQIVNMFSADERDAGGRDLNIFKLKLLQNESEYLTEASKSEIAEAYLVILPQLFQLNYARDYLEEHKALEMIEERIEKLAEGNAEGIIGARYRESLPDLLDWLEKMHPLSLWKTVESIEKKATRDLRGEDYRRTSVLIFTRILGAANNKWKVFSFSLFDNWIAIEMAETTKRIISRLLAHGLSEQIVGVVSQAYANLMVAETHQSVFSRGDKDAFRKILVDIGYALGGQIGEDYFKVALWKAHMDALRIVLIDLGGERFSIGESLKSIDEVQDKILEKYSEDSLLKDKIAAIYIDLFPVFFSKMDKRFDVGRGQSVPFNNIFEDEIKSRVKELLGDDKGNSRIDEKIDSMMGEERSVSKDTSGFLYDLEVRPNPVDLIGVSQEEIVVKAEARRLPVTTKNLDGYLHNLKGLLPYIELMVRQLLDEYQENRKIHFIVLGRDMELFGDALSVVLRGTELEGRVTTLPLSMRVIERLSVEDGSSEQFLRQFIDVEGIVQGEKEYEVLDSGFTGSAIHWMNNVIRVAMGQNALEDSDEKNMKPLRGRLIRSTEGWYPEFDFRDGDGRYSVDDFKYPSNIDPENKKSIKSAIESVTQLMPRFYGHTDTLKEKEISGKSLLFPISSIVESKAYTQYFPILSSIEESVGVSAIKGKEWDSVGRMDWQSPIHPFAAVTIQAEVVNHFAGLRKDILNNEGKWIEERVSAPVTQPREVTVFNIDVYWGQEGRVSLGIDDKTKGGID
ncbi:MAG: hypothetical protein KAR05_11085, partial [Candidatus Omnitrophica bacterium]|nr:hypothetical protein [Candidatus Omnitrophota bacterium]